VGIAVIPGVLEADYGGESDDDESAHAYEDSGLQLCDLGLRPRKSRIYVGLGGEVWVATFEAADAFAEILVSGD